MKLKLNDARCASMAPQDRHHEMKINTREEISNSSNKQQVPLPLSGPVASYSLTD